MRVWKGVVGVSIVVSFCVSVWVVEARRFFVLGTREDSVSRGRLRFFSISCEDFEDFEGFGLEGLMGVVEDGMFDE